MKVKKIFGYFVVFFIFSMIPCRTYGIELSKNFEFYGFIKLDTLYRTYDIQDYYTKDWDKLLSFSLADSRFGIRWKGKKIGKGWKVAAQIEGDLYYNSGNAVRIRQAFVTLTRKKSSFLFGRYWDLFSPLSPTTLMPIDHQLGFGNVGYWREQVRYTYSSKNVVFSVSANDPWYSSSDIKPRALPIIESRLGLKLGAKKQIKVGISGAYGKFQKCETSYPLVEPKIEAEVMGMCVDCQIPFGSLAFRGEFTHGKNLKHFHSHADVEEYNGEFEDRKVTSFWGQLVYKAKKYHFWLGYSSENLAKIERIDNYVSKLKVASCIFAGIKLVTDGSFSIGLEYAFFCSEYRKPQYYFIFKGREDDKTKQLMVSLMYNF